MSRAKLKTVKARTTFPCGTQVGGEHTIQPGENYWLLYAFRRRARFCGLHKPDEGTIRSFAPNSRADRAADQASAWNEAATELRDLVDGVRELVTSITEKKSESADVDAALEKLLNQLDGIDIDVDEFESLKEEMGEWRDNMDSGGLGGTPKFEEVEEVVDALEDIDLDTDLPVCQEIADGIDLGTDPTVCQEIADRAVEILEGFADDCEEKADELEEAASALEGIEFPRAY